MIGMPYPILPIEPKKITLEDITLNVLRTLFVPIPEDDENIQFRTCQIYGIPGVGKTSLFRFFGSEIINHYGKEKVNAVKSENLDLLMDNIKNKEVNALFLDDAGLQTQTAGKKLIAKFSRIRHILEEKRKNGAILVFFAVQDPFLLEKKFRSTLHVEIFKNAPTNDYDKRVLVQNIGYVALKELEHINKMVFQKHRYEYLSQCVARAVDTVGILKYPFISSRDSVLREIKAEGESQKTFSINEGDYGFLPLKEFVDSDSVIEALYNWTNIKEKIKLTTKLLKPRHIDAFIKYMQGQKYESIAESFNVTASSITNNYKAGGWLAIVRTEILGHLVEYQLSQKGKYYEGYKRISGKSRVDLMSPDKNKAVEIKVRQQRKTPAVDMLSKEMIDLLEKGFSCELCYCVIRYNSAVFKIFKITKKQSSAL